MAAMTRPALVALLLLAGCAKSPAADEKAPDPIASVTTARATRGTAARTVTIYGVSEAGAGSERALATEVEARLIRIAAPNGSAVRAGQVIAVLEPTPTSRLDAAKAATDAAAATLALARAQRLRADGLTSDADVETARTAAAAAKATAAAVAARGATLTVRAPVAGTVQALTARPGDVVPPGTAVATLAAGGPVRARFGIDPALAAATRPGQPLKIARPAGGAPIDGVVVGVDPQVDPTTRLASVFATLPAGGLIGPGETLRADLPTGAATAGVTVPYAALLDDGGRSFVFVIADGTAHQRNVTPGSSAGDSVVITRGIAPGERVVVIGGSALIDGMKVRETPS